MSVPEVTPDLSERAARVWWERATGEPWSPEAAESQDWQRLVVTAREWVSTMRAAGLAVVELPGPDGWVDAVDSNGEDARTPCWRTSWGTAWIEGVETPVWELREDLDAIRSDALKMLAAVAACERFRAQRPGGDPR